MPCRRYPEPKRCVLWDEPERVREGLKQNFELAAEYANESHHRQYLLRCRECSQLYFFEFYEEIDWDKGNDPQYTKYVPVSTIEEGAELARLDTFALSDASPRLCIDYPKEAKRPRVYWVR